MTAAADKFKSYIPLAGGADDGWSSDSEATATCYCGAVQLKFPTEAPGLVDVFVCNCPDCRKITASMFATNFTVQDTHLTHIRGRENLTSFSQARTIQSGSAMTNHFCSTCGTLMYRVSSGGPGKSILRVGTVDDFSLHETKLKPRVEQYVKDRVGWLHPVEGATEVQ
ncbi:Mss4-like protein [Mycena filopes]|nr:Mss4-like protein [Mycena filopes]